MTSTLICGLMLAQSALPNFIVIMADDLGYGEIGAFGQEKIETPNLDKLAKEGLVLTDFYSPSPVCAPTRCSLLTGLHQGHASIRGNKEVGGWGLNEGEGQWPMPDTDVTVAEALKPLGYVSGVFGKWANGGPGSEGHPLRQGFDEFFGYLCQRQAHNYYPTHLWRGHQLHLLTDNPYFPAHQKLTVPPKSYDAFRGGTYSPTLILSESLAFLEKHQKDPFFLYFPSTLPHVALQAPQEWVDRYPREWDKEPYLGADSYLPCERPRATYAAMISYFDHSVGAIVEAVDRLGLEKKSFILVTSDNGASPAGGADTAFFDSFAGLRGQKATLFQGGIRVPTIARWTGKIEPNRRSHRLATLCDLFPTLLELASGPARKGLDGESFATDLLTSSAMPRSRPLYFEFPAGGQQQAMIDGRWKALRRDLSQGVKTELYDLVADPDETTDLAQTHPDVVRRLERAMKAAHVPSPIFPIPALDK